MTQLNKAKTENYQNRAYGTKPVAFEKIVPKLTIKQQGFLQSKLNALKRAKTSLQTPSNANFT